MTFKKGIVTSALIVLVCTVPLVIILLLSFARNWVFPSVLPQQFTTASWVSLFTDTNGMGTSFLLTLFIALAVAALATAAGFFSSRFIAYHRHKKTLLLLAYLPFVLSPVILAVCLKYYFIKMGLAGAAWGVAMAQLVIAFPYSIIFFIGFWNNKVQQYTALVQTLGGTATHVFQKAILPLAKPMLLVCFFQCFLISWFEYGLTSVIGYGKVQTLTVMVYGFVTEANIFYAALSCCLLVLPPVVLLLINKKIVFRQGT